MSRVLYCFTCVSPAEVQGVSWVCEECGNANAVENDGAE